MTLEAWVRDLDSPVRLPPVPLREVATVDALVAEAMATIRQDYPRARLIAGYAHRLATSLHVPSAQGKAARLRGHVELLSGKSRAAVALYEAAWDHFQGDPVEQATTALTMIQALAYIGQYDRAFAIADRAIATYTEVNDEVRAARIRANVGNVLHRLDRYAEAEANYRLALPVLASAQALQDVAIVMRNYGVCLMGLQRFTEADAMYAEARTVLADSGQTNLLLEIDLNRAYLLGRQGLTFQALTVYRDLTERLPSDLPFEIGHCLLDQADFLVEAGLYTDALRAGDRALAIFAPLGAHLEMGKAHLIASLSALRRGDLEASHARHALARKYLRREPNANWHALLAQAEAERLAAGGRLRAAYRAVQRAMALGPVSERQAVVRELQLRLAFATGDLTSARQHLDEAPVAAYEATYQRRMGHDTAANAAALRALDEYDASRNRQESVGLRRSFAVAQSSRLRESFRALRDPHDRLEVVIRLKDQALAEMIASPDLLGPTRGEAPPTGLTSEAAATADLREQLRLRQSRALGREALRQVRAGTRVVEFFSDGDQLLAFLMQGAEVREVNLGDVDHLAELAESFHFHRLRAAPQAVRLVAKALESLSRLLAPALERAPKQLVIGRDEPLMTVPLHALPWANGVLMDHHTVTYVPNRQTLGVLPEVGRVDLSRPILWGAGDTRAPLIEAELEHLQRLLGAERAESLAGFEARLPRATLFHVAAHGVAREDEPMFSALLIGDERWTALRVLQSPISATLGVLSGCSTGVSTYGEARESQGFLEALLAAGCHAVLASLWDVPDAPAASWMTRFYEALPSGTVTTAYGEACRSTRSTWPSPADWAPFALFGNLS